MKTQRNIVLVVLGVVVIGLTGTTGLVLWLGWGAGLVVALLLLGLLLGIYLLLVRPWHLTWGATPDEAGADMPGDDRVPHGVVSTRAVTIDGAAADVWPWLVQIGFGRAGWYSYDWLDNDGIPSADRIIPELQGLTIGDQIELIPGMGPTVVAVQPQEWLVAAADDGSSSWCLQLVPHGGQVRLISRWRNAFEVTPATAFIVALSDPGAFVMEQKMLRTIRDRVEAGRAVSA